MNHGRPSPHPQRSAGQIEPWSRLLRRTRSLALILGVGMRVAAVAGATLLALIYAAQLWPERNPFVDEHVVYGLLLAGLAVDEAGDVWGLGRRWRNQKLVRRFPLLR